MVGLSPLVCFSGSFKTYKIEDCEYLEFLSIGLLTRLQVFCEIAMQNFPSLKTRVAGCLYNLNGTVYHSPLMH